jgi:hypothetical protein
MNVSSALGRGALIAVLLGGMSATMLAQTDSAKQPKPAVPKALADAGEYGENIYDAAKANDWTVARARLTALNGAVKQVSVEKGSAGKAEDSLERNVAALERSVVRRERRATMQQANQVTLNVADMTAGYALRVPVQVTRLDFYGRELEIWSAAGNASRLKATAEGMLREWDAVRPKVEEPDPAEAKKFGALVSRVEVAKVPAEYGRLAGPLLEEVDNLEKVFER